MTKTMLATKAITIAALMVVMVGCSGPPDQRVADLAQQSVNQQANQSEQLAMQSEQIASTARELVAADAHSRQELMASLAKLQDQIQSQHAVFDRQRDELERERRELAAQRGRDPVIAQAIGAMGITLACVLPLLLAGYVLYTVNRASPAADADAVSEALIGEVVSPSSERASSSRMKSRSVMLATGRARRGVGPVRARCAHGPGNRLAPVAVGPSR